MRRTTKFIFILAAVLLFGSNLKPVSAAENSASALYVPLIGITSVPDPLAFPSA